MDEQVQSMSEHPATKPVLYVLAGFLAGLGLGYFLGQRNRRMPSPPPEELAKISNEVAAIKARREAVKEIKDRVRKEAAVNEDIVIAGKRFAEDPANYDPDIRTEGPDVIITRIADEDWDYEEEKKTRDSLSPYVIHKDEFWSNEMEFAQHTWTYYEGDDVMIDEEDVVVYNHDQKIGEMKFGHGSGDKDTVYIRNEKMKMEMEVLREEGLYSIEVMGMEIDRGEDENVEHSMMKKQKRGKKDERLT